MKKTRQLHLWIGLISSIFILIQSITGLIITEPWLIGGSEREGMGGGPGRFPMQQAQQSQTNANAGQSGSDGTVTGDAAQNGGSSDSGAGGQNGFESGMPPMGGEGGGDTLGFIKNLHKGMINGTDVSWLIDLTAIAMILLTATGIILSIKTLRAQRISRRKRAEREALTK